MLDQLKEELIKIAKAADSTGLCRRKSGNFSVKDPQTGYVLITPTQVAREVLTTKDIAVIGPDGNIVEIESPERPSSELQMHLTAYRARPDIFAVVHTHSCYATALAVQSREIKPIVLEAVAFGGKAPLAKYGRTGTKALADSIIEPLKSADACLLEKHGSLAVGRTLEEAYLNAHYVEDVAKIYFLALQLGSEPEPIPEDEVNTILHKT